MTFWNLERVPEQEEMDDADEVASYNSAAGARHLDAIDETFVDHLARLLPASGSSAAPLWGLDVGCGPAQIPIKVLKRYRNLKIVAVDRSPNMLACARSNAARVGVLERLLPLRADGSDLPFPDKSFSVVMCNSTLHHARAPVRLLREIFRVARPDGAVLVRDLRRPARPFLGWHLWRHGHFYNGLMRQIFEASVKASYTVEELEGFLREARGKYATVFRFGGAHLGIERGDRKAE